MKRFHYEMLLDTDKKPSTGQSWNYPHVTLLNLSLKPMFFKWSEKVSLWDVTWHGQKGLTPAKADIIIFLDHSTCLKIYCLLKFSEPSCETSLNISKKTYTGQSWYYPLSTSLNSSLKPKFLKWSEKISLWDVTWHWQKSLTPAKAEIIFILHHVNRL